MGIPKQARSSLIKKAFGGASSDNQRPKAVMSKNIIMPACGAISHKYTFIIETLIDLRQPFSVADYTDNNGLFACLLAQDFEQSTCYIITKNKTSLELSKEIKQQFQINNLKTKKAALDTTNIVTDITIHETPTIAMLNKMSPKSLAELIAKKTGQYAIVDIPSLKTDINSKKILGEKITQVNELLQELLRFFWITTYVPVVYNNDAIRSCYILEKRN